MNRPSSAITLTLIAALALLSTWLQGILALDTLSLGVSLVLGSIGIVAILYAEDEDEHTDFS